MELSPNVPSGTQEQILRARWDAAIKSANTVTDQALKVRLDVAKDRVVYFEKIAVGAGAAVTLLVTFVGSHSSTFRPRWLFRSALESLVLAMITAMFRNLRYPHYLISVHEREAVKAIRGREETRLDYVVAVRPSDMRTGEVVDAAKMKKDFGDVFKALDEKIEAFDKHQKSTWRYVRCGEVSTLVLVMAGMIALVALAWLNF